MKRGLIRFVVTIVSVVMLTGCAADMKGDLIKKDALENQPKSNYGDRDYSVTFASPTPTPTPVPTYVPEENFGKPVETEQDYRDYAEYILLRRTKFYLINTRMQPYEGVDSMGMKNEQLSTVTIVAELPDIEKVLLDNKYNLEYKDVVKGMTFEVQFSHGMSWQEPAIANETFEKFEQGLTKYAVVRSSMLGSPTRNKLIVVAKLNDKQYLHSVENETLNLSDMSKFGGYGVVRSKIADYYLYSGLVDMKISPLGTSIIATFAFTNFSSMYEPEEDELTKNKIKGTFTGDAEQKQYEGTLSYEFNGIRVSKLGTFFATFEFPMQGSTSSLKDRIIEEFEPVIYNERDEEIAAFRRQSTDSKK